MTTLHRVSRFFGLAAAISGGTAGSAVANPAAGEPGPRVLFGRENAFCLQTLETRGAAIAFADSRLQVTSAGNHPDRGVVLPLQADQRDLSGWRHVEVEVWNQGEQPVTFTFWALSGHGWGGGSSFSVSGGAGRETLAAGARDVFRIDLHARYSGDEVYTKALNPAAVRWLELVLPGGNAPFALSLGDIRAVGTGPMEPHEIAGRIQVPEVTRAPPAAGRRVYQQLPGWEDTEVAHVLSLPRDWAPGRQFPVIVEYTGNVFYHKFCHSTGRTDQGNLAYGLSRGEGFIGLSLPFISLDGRREQIDGWGDIDRTIDYCLAALRLVAEKFGGDPAAVFFTGFSRGSYAANYLGLRHDRIAQVWAGFITLRNPGALWREDSGRGWRDVGVGWNERAARMKSGAWFHVPAQLGPEVHVDVEYLEDRPSTVATRQWLHEQVAQIRGQSAPAHPASR